MDHTAALLRCVFTHLPLAKIKETSRDKKAKDMDVLADKYCAKLCDETSPAFHEDGINHEIISRVLMNWLGVMSTAGGDGNTVSLGKKPHRGRNRFQWDDFYLEDEAELQKIVDSAIFAWNDANNST